VRPDQERVGRIRRAEIAVAGSFDDEPEIIVARERDRCGYIRRIARRDGIDARLRRPGIKPAAGLRQGDLILDVVRVLQSFEGIDSGCSRGRAQARVEWRPHFDEPALRRSSQRLPFRLRGPRLVCWADSSNGRGFNLVVRSRQI